MRKLSHTFCKLGAQIQDFSILITNEDIWRDINYFQSIVVNLFSKFERSTSVIITCERCNYLKRLHLVLYTGAGYIISLVEPKME